MDLVSFLFCLLTFRSNIIIRVGKSHDDDLQNVVCKVFRVLRERCLIFEFFQGQNAKVSKKTKVLVINYERIFR